MSPSPPLSSSKRRLGSERVPLLINASVVMACVVAWLVVARSVWHHQPDPGYRADEIWLYGLLFGGIAAAFVVQPLVSRVPLFRNRPETPAITAAALALCCVFLFWFIVHCGRHQFGGFDYNIVFEVGWRQALGQRLYSDFVVATPPFFSLALKYVFQAFGVSWDNTLFLTAAFSMTTFLWCYWMLRLQALSRSASVLVALVLQSICVLPLSFWWYNDTTLMLAAVFLLACLALARHGEKPTTQISFVVAFVTFALTKPNIAALGILGGVMLLFVASPRKTRVVVLTIVALVLTWAVFPLNHLSIPDMLASYRSVARERGGFSIFGYRQLGKLEQHGAQLWYAMLSVPLLVLAPQFLKAIRGRNWRETAVLLFFPLALLMAVYGLMSNGEIRDAECTTLIAAGGVVMFSVTGSPWKLLLRRFYIAVLFGTMVGDLYLGVARMRVSTIGQHMFFESYDNEHLITSGPLRNMRVSETMVEVQQQIEDAVHANPGTVFFGPRVDFNYAVLGIPSPAHFSAWWHPGTAFGRDRVPALLSVWEAGQFQTLIFLKGDYTFYPPRLMEDIHNGYIEDDRYPRITVYHRRPASP